MLALLNSKAGVIIQRLRYRRGGCSLIQPLLFGLWSAPKIFNAVADAVGWILRNQGVSFVMHYFNDFLLVGQPALTECDAALATSLQVFEQLGLPVAVLYYRYLLQQHYQPLQPQSGPM